MPSLDTTKLTFLGMILFPLGEPLFADLGPDGISMFYVSCIVSQLVYSCGGSMFKGGVGSEMVGNPYIFQIFSTHLSFPDRGVPVLP